MTSAPARDTDNTATEEAEVNPPVVTSLLAGYLLVAFATLVVLLIRLWPFVDTGTSQAATPETEEIDLFFDWLPITIDHSQSLILLAATVGAIGSFLHAATSLTDYIGNRRFLARWAAWYALRLPVGAALAVVFYLVIRAGFITSDAGSEVVNPFGIAAVAGMAGMFSKQATDKLREVFETFFKVGKGAGDDARADSLTNPKPVVEGIEPRRTDFGKEATFQITGKEFIAESMVRVGHEVVKPDFISPRQLKVKIKASLLERAGDLEVTVTNPEPGGGSSLPLHLRVLPQPDDPPRRTLLSPRKKPR